MSLQESVANKERAWKVLRSYLRKNLGKPWDKTYSRLCDIAHGDSGLYLLRDLKYCVILHPWIDPTDGTVYEGAAHYQQRRAVDSFYVHPATGILCEQHIPREKNKEEPVTEIKISDDEKYMLINGVWFYNLHRVIEHDGLTEKAPYFYSYGKVTLPVAFIDGKHMFAAHWTERVDKKRQLSKKELKKLGLVNAPPDPKPLSRREHKALAAKEKR